LKREDTRYEFADRHFPSLPAVSGSVSEIESDPLQTVIGELGHVISSATATETQKRSVLARAYGIPNVNSFRSSLQAGLDVAENQDLKYRIQAELVSRGDLSALRSSIDLLLESTLDDAQRRMFLLVIANDVKTSESLPIIMQLLQSGDPLARRAVAEALWNIANPSTIPELARALQDPDREVQFYAVRALSDIANEPGWGGPSESEFQRHQQKYLTHWQDWTKGRIAVAP
jgi:HEAT repeats